MIELRGKHGTAKVMIDQVEPECVEQIRTFLDHEAFTQPVAIMPDTHAGKGSVIGFTMRMTDKVIPNVVGVDVGCGVCSVNIGKAALPELPVLDNRIRQRVPMGFEVNERKLVSIDDFPWKDFRRTRDKIGSIFGFSEGPSSKEDEFLGVCARVGSDVTRTLHSVGSLGGGNHFIEIGRDDDGDAWITIHTGSRNFGLRVADYCISLGFYSFMGAWRVEVKKSTDCSRLLLVLDSACLYDDDGFLLVDQVLRRSLMSSRNFNALVKEDYRGPEVPMKIIRRKTP